MKLSNGARRFEALHHAALRTGQPPFSWAERSRLGGASCPHSACVPRGENIRVVDSHAHVDEYEAFGWFDPPEAMIGLMDEAGVEKAVVMAYADAPVLKPDALRYLYDACKKYAGRLIPYARINPHAGNAVSLLEEAIVDLGMKGLKIHQESVTAAAYHEAVVRLIKRAAEFNAPILFHTGDESLSLLQQFAKLAEEAPEAFDNPGPHGRLPPHGGCDPGMREVR